MDELAVVDVDQSGSDGTHAQRSGADRVRVRQPALQHQLCGRGVGPAKWQSRHGTGGLGHVLQRDGDPAGWPAADCRRHAAIRPVFWTARHVSLRSSDRYLHRPTKHGAWTLVSDGDQPQRWLADDLFRSRREWKYQHDGRNLQGRYRMELARHRALDATTLSAPAPAAGRQSLP